MHTSAPSIFSWQSRTERPHAPLTILMHSTSCHGVLRLEMLSGCLLQRAQPSVPTDPAVARTVPARPSSVSLTGGGASLSASSASTPQRVYNFDMLVCTSCQCLCSTVSTLVHASANSSTLPHKYKDSKSSPNAMLEPWNSPLCLSSPTHLLTAAE